MQKDHVDCISIMSFVHYLNDENNDKRKNNQIR